jgi:hypothetical protein
MDSGSLSLPAKLFCAKFRIYMILCFLDCCKILFRCLLSSPHSDSRKTWKSPHFDTRFLEVARTWQDSGKCLMTALSCSQIWLFPLVDGCHCGYITKLKKKPPDSYMMMVHKVAKPLLTCRLRRCAC